MSTFNPYRQYREVGFSTADQGRLIMISYDAAIRFCRSGAECIANNDRIGKGKWLTKAFEIVGELRRSLRPQEGSDVSRLLTDTYAFIEHQITTANIRSDVNALNNALQVLESLRQGWQEILQNNRLQKTEQRGIA